MRDRFSCVEGVDELMPHIGAAQHHMPGLRLQRKGEARHCQGTVIAEWTALGPDGAPRGQGTNVFTLGPDGRIESVTGFWGLDARRASRYAVALHSGGSTAMKVREIMTRRPCYLYAGNVSARGGPENGAPELRLAAGRTRAGTGVVGIVTDRDIVMRVGGQGPEPARPHGRVVHDRARRSRSRTTRVSTTAWS